MSLQFILRFIVLNSLKMLQQSWKILCWVAGLTLWNLKI